MRRLSDVSWWRTTLPAAVHPEKNAAREASLRLGSMLAVVGSRRRGRGMRHRNWTPDLLVAGFGCLLFFAGWALAASGVGEYLLLPGLVLCALGGWLFRGWRGAAVAPLLAMGVGIVLLIITNATAAAWHEPLHSDAPAVQTPSPGS